MTTTLLLRIASVISLLFTAGHSLGGLKKWSPMGENEVLKTMTAIRFECYGREPVVPRLLYGLRVVDQHADADADGAAVADGLDCRTKAAAVRPMIVIVALATLPTGVISWRFIFPVPALFSARCSSPWPRTLWRISRAEIAPYLSRPYSCGEKGWSLHLQEFAGVP